MRRSGKALVWLSGVIETPPFSMKARVEAGVLLRRLQQGEKLSMPHVRPMPSIGLGCQELRIRDDDKIWRIFYFIGTDAIVLLEIARKETRAIPKRVLDRCRTRLKSYKDSREGED